MEDVDSDVYQKMKDLNTIVEIHFYPDSPVGFYKLYNYDLNLIVDEVFEFFEIGINYE